jgi:hypothetical protein
LQQATIEHFTMVVIVATPAEILQLGLQVVGISMVGRHETNMERFMAHFGTSPESCSAIFVDLQTTQNATARIAKPDILYFFVALNWLKTYRTEAQTAGTFKLDEKTVRKYVWNYVWAIQALKDQKVRADIGLFCTTTDTLSNTVHLSLILDCLASF